MNWLKETIRGSHIQGRPATCEAQANDGDDQPPAAGGGIPQQEEPVHQGKLILDATVAPQAIRYPTDLSLLNEARVFNVQIIDILYPPTD